MRPSQAPDCHWPDPDHPEDMPCRALGIDCYRCQYSEEARRLSRALAQLRLSAISSRGQAGADRVPALADPEAV